jgi:hypothetical protein
MLVFVSIACGRRDEVPAGYDSPALGSQAPSNSGGASLGKPLFSCGVASFARESVAYGNVIDDHGLIWFYDLGKTWSAVSAGGDLYLESALRDRFVNLVLRPERVSDVQLAAMRRMAQYAQEGRIEKQHVKYDGGAFGCEAYVWEKSDAYKEVELGSRGDFVIRNLSPEAARLEKWLLEDLDMGWGKPGGE